MRNKQIIMLLATVFMLVSCSVSVEVKDPSGKMYSKTMSDETFNEIKACSFFDVKLHKSDKYWVDIEVSEELKDYLVVEVNDGRLLLCFDDENGKCSEYVNLKAHADIYIPSFKKIDISGASSLETADTFKVDKAELYLSGASEIENFYMIASGVKVRASGGSSLDAEIYADSLNMRLSGASDVDLNTINGKAGKTLTVDISGASDADVFEFPFENILVNCSGASELELYPIKKLEGRVSGASEITYKRTSKDLIFDVMSTGSSSVKEK